MNARKLLLNDKVEVRQIEEGLQGSWYSAVVVGVSDMTREVKYDELLCENEDSKLVESIPVTGEIDGVYQRPCVKTNYRGRIRPLPSGSEAILSQDGLSFGFCVDVLFEDAWWEGVIFDSNDGLDERSVFFPDEGDERHFKVSNLRVTQEWDEFSGTWGERGIWTLVKLTEESTTNIPLAKYTKFVWSHLRVNYGFQKMISEWTCGANSVWKQYFMEVVCVIANKSIWRDLGHPISSRVAAVRQKGKKVKMCQTSDKDVDVYSKTSHRNNMIVQSFNSKCDFPSELKKLDDCINSGVNCSITQTLASSEKSQQTDLRRTSSNQCEISNVSSDQMNKRVEDVATTSDHSVRNNKKQSRNVITSRKIQEVENNLELQKVKPFLARQQQQIRFRNRSPRKQRHIRTGLRSHAHVNKTQNCMQRQMEKNIATRFPQNYNLRMLSFNFRKKRSCLKVKKRFPKRILRSNAKNKVSCTKEGPVSEMSQKGDNGIDIINTACQQEVESTDAVPVEKQRIKKSRRNDPVCFVCQYGDDLRPCDNCTSSYHVTCIGLEVVPDANWFCPSCRCGLCGLRSPGEDELFTEVCYQCSRQYHRDCLYRTDIPGMEASLPEKFCSKRCFQICARLHEHLQTIHTLHVDGLSWTMTRSRRNDYSCHDERIHPHVQLSQVMKVLHECFEPTIEPHTKKDLVSEVVYNSSSKFKRLDFHGFYVMVLLNGEELACVATLRIHGHKVAEMPLIATPFKYRRKGMARLLMREMEKMLIELGVEKLVLPAISQLRETWMNVFAFEEMPASVRQELSGYPFLVFSGTSMFQKVLSKLTLTKYPSVAKQQTKSTTARVYQECENGNGEKFGLSYMRRGRSRIVTTKDQRTTQGLYSKRGKRSETCDKDKMTIQGSYCTRRRRTEIVGKERMSTQASNRSTSPVKCIYKRRRVLASRE